MARARGRRQRGDGVMIYEASLRGVISDVLIGEFADCEVSTGAARTGVRFSPDLLGAMLARFQDFGLELVELRLRSDPDRV